MPAWLVFIYIRHGSTDLRTSESLVVKWRILLHGENLLKCESCANGSCLGLPQKLLHIDLSCLYFYVWLGPSFITQNIMWNFCSLAETDSHQVSATDPYQLRWGLLHLQSTPYGKKGKKNSSPLSFSLWILLQNFWRQTMRHKLPCELLTYACLHMISYSQNRLRFEGLTAVEFPLLWIIQISLFITYFIL